MALFKYMSIDSAEKYFGSSMLKASRPREFNDVLDAYPVLPHVPMSEIEEWARINTDRRKENNRLFPRPDLEDSYNFTYGYELSQAKKVAYEERTTFNELYRQEIYRIVCFCRSGRHPLMWAHYANNHEGVQLEFDENHKCFEGRLHNVIYVEDRPVLALEEMRRIATSVRDPSFPVPSFFFSKALEWAYEQEVRLCVRRDETIAHGNVNPLSLYRVPFDALRSITFGLRSRHSSLGLQDLILSELERAGVEIKVHQLEISNTEYKLEKREAKLLRRSDWDKSVVK